MPRHHRNRHTLRATIGTIGGLSLAIAAAVGTYLTFVPGRGTHWAFLVLPSLPLAAWGASHLARCRGYSSGAGYGLFMFGFFISSFIAGTHTPLTIGFAFVFVALFPVVLLFGLPKKSGHSRHG